MPLISPTGEEIQDVDSISLEDISDVLISSGLDPQKVYNAKTQSLAKSKETDYDEQARVFKNTLNEQGASVENAATTIAEIMLSDRLSAQSRLRAAELVLDLHGSRNKDGEINKTPVFNFVINDNRVNVNQIFSPHRTREFVKLNSCEEEKASEAIIDGRAEE